MKLTIRRIGNSLGVIIPRVVLQRWGVGEGDDLVLGDAGLGPISPSRSTHEALDELKRRIAVAVVAQFTAHQIRAHSLANLHRWKVGGVWGPVYDEWVDILENDTDGRLFAIMLGRDETATRLRQSAPYVGLLPREELRKLNEEAAR